MRATIIVRCNRSLTYKTTLRRFIDIQWLQSDNQAQWLKVAVAICLTLSTPYIFRIFVSSFLGFARWISSGRETSNPPRDEEVQPLTPTRLMNDAKTGRQMLRRFYDAFRQKESKLEIRHQFFYFFVLSTLCFAFFSQIIASSILTDKMTTNRMGLLASSMLKNAMIGAMIKRARL